MTPTLYKQYVEAIIYHIQTKLQVHLPADLRHDIYMNVREAVVAENAHAKEWDEQWKKSYVELRKQGHPLNWNEMKIRIAREKEPIDPQVILKWMFMRENGISLRGLIPDDQSILDEILGKEEWENGQSDEMANDRRATAGVYR